jgi:hypothetical protein
MIPLQPETVQKVLDTNGTNFHEYKFSFREN